MTPRMRERDRERAQARSGGKPKAPKNDGLTPEQRRESYVIVILNLFCELANRDAKALQEKAAKKAAQVAAGGENKKDGTKIKK
ncbi:hypothetical protein Ancab_022069 [Ancistrocladus abbreviatus]